MNRLAIIGKMTHQKLPHPSEATFEKPQRNRPKPNTDKINDGISNFSFLLGIISFIKKIQSTSAMTITAIGTIKIFLHELLKVRPKIMWSLSLIHI